MTRNSRIVFASVLCLPLLLSACGQKGSLYLPEQETTEASAIEQTKKATKNTSP